jgi:hypothetical protein
MLIELVRLLALIGRHQELAAFLVLLLFVSAVISGIAKFKTLSIILLGTTTILAFMTLFVASIP